MKVDVQQIQQIAARMAAANDQRAVRRMTLLFVTLIVHTTAKWTIVPALVLALITGQAFFVKAFLIAMAIYGFGGVDDFTGSPFATLAGSLRPSPADR